MAQHDFDIANQTFPNTRTDLNLALKAIASQNSGVSEPTTMFANMMWYDTGNNILKMRNEANDAWIDVINLNQTTTGASPAFRGLLTTSGDMFYMGAAGANVRLAVGSADRVIRTDGLVPSWGQLTSGVFASGIVTADIIAPGAVTATKLADQIPVQADQTALEAETDENTYAPPDLIRHSPGVCKAWVEFTVAVVVDASYNVTDVTDNGAGDWTVNIATDMSGAGFAVGASANPTGGNTNRSIGADSSGAGTIAVRSELSDGSLSDPGSPISAWAFGDQ